MTNVVIIILGSEIERVSCCVFETSSQSGPTAGIFCWKGKKGKGVSRITSGLNVAKYNCEVVEGRGNGDAYQQASALSTAVAHPYQKGFCSGWPLCLTA